MNIYSIYKAVNIKNGKTYIGFDSSWPSRKTKHLYDYQNKLCNNYECHFYRAIRKYGKESFLWEIVYQSWDKNHCLNEMEPFFIKEHNSYIEGYNMTLGGEGTLGKQSWLGKKHSEETKSKISLALKGRCFSEEHKIKLSKWQKGKSKKPFTDEHKRKISESLKKRFLPTDLV